MALKLYHGSRDQFESFDIAKGGTFEDRASNGALGIWLSVEPGLAENYAANGGHLYEVSVEAGSVHPMPVDVLMQHHREASKAKDPIAYYAELRSRLIAEGHSLVAVMEYRGAGRRRDRVPGEAVAPSEIADCVDMYVALSTRDMRILARRDGPSFPAPTF